MVMRNRPYKAGAAWGFIDRNQTGMEIMFVHAPNDHRLLVQQLGIAISAEESKRFFLCLRDGGTVVDCQSPFFDQPLFRRGKRTGASMRSEEHTSELQSLMRISYAVFCLKKKNKTTTHY